MTLRWHWGIGITAVYVVFASSTIGFVVFAMRQQVDLVSGDYYEQSLRHDARMAATAEADALDDAFSITSDARSAAVIVTWPAGMRVQAGTITLYRPSDSRDDRRFAAEPDDTGRQLINTRPLGTGLWTVRVEWTAGDRSFFAERRLMLP
jgi:hypothetical protein